MSAPRSRNVGGPTKGGAKRPGSPSPRGLVFDPTLLDRFLPPLLIALPIAIAAWFLVLERRIAGDWGFALDDSWIHATMARNLATGHGFSFNPGEPVAGSTAPIYTALLALLYLATHEVVWTSKVIGVACLIGSALLTYRLTRRLMPETAVPAALAALLVATSPGLLWAALSGMEIMLYVLLIVAGALAWHEGRDRLAPLLFALGVWVRPDGVLLLALFLALQPRKVLSRLVVVVPVVGLYVGFNLWIGHTVFPQTVGVKAHFGFDPIGRTLNLIREWMALWGVPYRPTDQTEHPILLLALILIGAVWSIRRWPLLALYVIGLPIALSLFRVHSASHKRYILLIIPYAMILAAMGATWIASWAKSPGRGRALAALAVIALAWQATLLPTMRRDYAWNVQNINHMQVKLAQFAKLVTAPGAKIATNDIGAFGYFSDRYVVDLMGLVTPLRPLPEQLQKYRPELVFMFVSWFKEYMQDDPVSGNYRFWDADSLNRYELIAGVELRRNTISANARMTAYIRLGKNDPSPKQRFLYVF